jgi:hypothetical protein
MRETKQSEAIVEQSSGKAEMKDFFFVRKLIKKFPALIRAECQAGENAFIMPLPSFEWRIVTLF